MKFALVGYGRWGKKVAKKLSSISSLNCVSSNRDLKTLQQDLVEDGLSCKAMDFCDVLIDDSIKNVAVAVPIDCLYEVAKKCLLAGKHVFLEKPGSSTHAKLSSLIEIAKSKKLVLFINYIYASDPAYKLFVDQIGFEHEKNIVAIWKKQSRSSSPSYQNMVPHILYLIMEALKTDRIQLLESSQRGVLEFKCREYRVSITCDDNSKDETFQLTCGSSSWSPRAFTKDLVTSSNHSDLLAAQIDAFRLLTKHGKLDNQHLKKASSIAMMIDQIRGFR
jgi:hypothetical protein